MVGFARSKRNERNQSDTPDRVAPIPTIALPANTTHIIQHRNLPSEQ